VGFDLLHGARQIAGFDALAPPGHRQGFQLLPLVADHRRPVVVDLQLASLHVPAPGADLGAFDHPDQFFALEHQLLFDALAPADVEQDAGNQSRTAVGVAALHAAAAQHPNPMPLSVAQAKLDLAQ